MEDYAELILLDPSNADHGIQRSIPLRDGLRLGRVLNADYADIAIRSSKFEAMVSRKHATIKKTASGWFITDENSTNGILIVEKQIPAGVPVELHDGNVVTIGNIESDLVYSFELNRRKPVDETAGKAIHNLKQLKEQGWVNQEQFEEHAKAIEEAMPPPNKWMNWGKTPHHASDIKGISDTEFMLTLERVFKYTYSFRRKEWLKSAGLVAMEPKPFGEGAMRRTYRLTDYTKPEGASGYTERQYVAKIMKEGSNDHHTYFADVEMQELCGYFAEEFNKLNPPKKVSFVEASVIEFIERPNRPIFACEPFIEGKYTKHNNNWGYVSPDDRNTPQSFSHFTYNKSQGFFIVVDIQGVGDRYTDPQVHSRDKVGFGKGNMGLQGINKFFQTHYCNSICVKLGISTAKVKTADKGTGAVNIHPNPHEASPQKPMMRVSGGGVGGFLNQKPAHSPKPPGGSPVDHGEASDPLYVSEEELHMYGVNKEALEWLKRIWLRFDLNHSGFIPKSELFNLGRALDFSLELRHTAQIKTTPPDNIAFRDFLNFWSGIDEQ